jgi:hypothetical protein
MDGNEWTGMARTGQARWASQSFGEAHLMNQTDMFKGVISMKGEKKKGRAEESVGDILETQCDVT